MEGETGRYSTRGKELCPPVSKDRGVEGRQPRGAATSFAIEASFMEGCSMEVDRRVLVPIISLKINKHVKPGLSVPTLFRDWIRAS